MVSDPTGNQYFTAAILVPSEEHQHGVSIQNSRHLVYNFSEERANENSPRPKSWRGCFISAIYHVADSGISFTLLHGLVSRLYRRQIVVLDLICETVSV